MLHWGAANWEQIHSILLWAFPVLSASMVSQISNCCRTVLQFRGSLFREPNTAGQMCTSPHSMTEELKMHLPSVGSFLVGLFSFPPLHSQIGSSFSFLPLPSESRVLFLPLWKSRVFFLAPSNFLDCFTLELFQLQGPFAFKINGNESVKRFQCFIVVLWPGYTWVVVTVPLESSREGKRSQTQAKWKEVESLN